MAFWCDATIYIHVDGPHGERDVVIQQPWAQIGSHPRSAIVLEGAGVRKRALLLWATKLGVYAANLDREEAPLDEVGHWLTSNQPLVVGPYQLTVRLESGKTALPATPDLIAARSVLPIPVLHVFGDRLLKDRRRLRHPLSLVGRRPQCSLQLRGVKVSSYHAALYWQDQRLWCIDLSSGNGTLLNGEPLDCGEVRLNDRLEIGEFELLHYRWSPRNSTPGMEHLAPEEEGAIWDSRGGDLALEGSLIGSAIATPADDRTTFDEDQFRQRMMAELDERIAAEREARTADQSAWNSEREALLGELSTHRAELLRLKAELQAAAEAQQKLADARPSGGTPEGQLADSMSSDAVPAPHVEFVQGFDIQKSSVASPNSALPAVLRTHEAGETEEAAAETTNVIVKTDPVRRRQPRGELTSFVSGRLSDLEHVQRRKMLILWAVAIATVVAIAAIGFGVWVWLG